LNRTANGPCCYRAKDLCLTLSETPRRTDYCASGPHARLVWQPIAAPLAHIKGRVGQDVIGLEVFVQVAMEAVGRFVAEIAFSAANGEVHFGQPPGGRIAFPDT